MVVVGRRCYGMGLGRCGPSTNGSLSITERNLANLLGGRCDAGRLDSLR